MDTVENNFLLLDMDLYLNTIYFHTWSWHVIQVKFKLVWTLGVTFLSTQIRDGAQAVHPFILSKPKSISLNKSDLIT